MAKKKATTSRDDTAARMFEFHQGSSDKFWSIELAGNGKSHTVRYGRVGTDGQTSTKAFPDKAKTQASYDKLVEQKVKKGYQEVVASESRSEQVKLSRQELKQHEPFLNAILEDPDDLGNYGVYADWMCEHGNPRGELMNIQLRLEDESVPASERKKLQKEEKKLLSANASDWLGELAPYLIEQKQPEDDGWGSCYVYRFARGFLDSVSVRELFEDFAPDFGKSSQTRMLRQLLIEGTSYEHQQGLTDLARGKFDNLREFHLGGDGHTNGEGVEKLIRRMPRIETIGLLIQHCEIETIFKLKMPCLRSLTVNNMSDYPLAVLAKNKSLGELRTLRCFPHALEHGDDAAYISRANVRALCRSKNLPKLQHLELYCSDLGNEGVQEFIRSGMLSQLKVLDLSFGCITDEGAELLAAADLGGLDKLILDGNYLSKKAIKELRRSKLNLQADAQYSGEPDDELEYLWNGDIE